MGVVDLIGSYADFDVWTDFIGVQLPDIIWRYSAWIEIALGFLLIKIGMAASSKGDE